VKTSFAIPHQVHPDAVTKIFFLLIVLLPCYSIIELFASIVVLQKQKLSIILHIGQVNVYNVIEFL